MRRNDGSEEEGREEEGWEEALGSPPDQGVSQTDTPSFVDANLPRTRE
jgi:hypothetical protein